MPSAAASLAAVEAENPGRDAIVIRFRPTDPQSVKAQAGKEFRRVGHYGLSVFSASPDAGESHDQVVERLLAISEIQMPAAGNKKYYLCGQAGDLYDEGFEFLKDGDADELPNHYCVRLDVDEPTLDTVQSFLGHFTERKRSA